MPLIKDNQREDTWYAYIAGLIDGEGTIAIRKVKTPGNNSPKYQGLIQMVNTNYEVVEMVSKLFEGTTVYGKSKKKYPGSFQSRKQIYVTKISGTVRITKYLDKIYPYLRIKKKQADLVYELCDESRKVFPPTKGISRSINRVSAEEAQRRENIYQKYQSLVHPQRLSEKTPKGEAIV